MSSSAPCTLFSLTFRAVHAATGRARSETSSRPAPATAGPAPGGTSGSTPRRRVPVRPRRLQRHEPVRPFGLARRVTAMVGVAIPEREVNGRRIRVEADDNAHVLLDFGNARFAVVTTGFTMQRYRSPAIEVYGSEGTVQLLGDDWAPEGWELWRNGDGAWRIFPESDPHWHGPRGCDTSSNASRRDGPP